MKTELTPEVKACFEKNGLLNDGSNPNWHAEWFAATRGETPAQARARAKALDALVKA